MLYIPNVTQAAIKILFYYQAGDYEKLSSVKEYLENNDVARSIAGNPDEFHNAGAELASHGFYEYAYALIKVGQLRYPWNTDLIGDLLCYGLYYQSMEELQHWADEIVTIKKRFWTWRAYVFLGGFLLRKIQSAETDDNISAFEAEILDIINDFKSNFKYLTDKSDCEKAYILECDLYDSQGDNGAAIRTLQEATNELPNKCAQCALRLADRKFETGDYVNALHYAQIATSIKEGQASIDLGYAYYIFATSLEWETRQNNALATNADEIYVAYFAAYNHLDNQREATKQNVKKQVAQIEYETGIQSSIDFNALN